MRAPPMPRGFTCARSRCRARWGLAFASTPSRYRQRRSNRNHSTLGHRLGFGLGHCEVFRAAIGTVGCQRPQGDGDPQWRSLNPESASGQNRDLVIAPCADGVPEESFALQSVCWMSPQRPSAIRPLRRLDLGRRVGALVSLITQPGGASLGCHFRGV